MLKVFLDINLSFKYIEKAVVEKTAFLFLY